MRKHRVLLVDDHSLVRLGLSALIGCQKDFEVVGEAADGAEAVRIADKIKPDLVVMDLMMPGMDGVEATKRIRENDPSAKVLVLTTFGTSADVARTVAAGAAGAVSLIGAATLGASLRTTFRTPRTRSVIKPILAIS